MIYEIYTENGTKKKRALTGNGYGLPLGSIIAVYSNLVPDGYLPCNGAVYDTTTYAALYAYLGSNRLPDLRECNLVGAGQSSNDYDASTNPNGIHEHDVYVVGEFKDDQFQGHRHKTQGYTNTTGDGTVAITGRGGAPYNIDVFSITVSSDGTNGDPRTGTTTHGKQVGVNYCIKATPAYVEPDTVSDMVNTLRTQDSYSTSEVNTGKKWIDGKPIYRRVIDDWTPSVSSSYDVTSWNIDKMVNIGGFIVEGNGNILNIPYYVGSHDGLAMYLNNTKTSLIAIITGSYATTNVVAVIEYTKTTD